MSVIQVAACNLLFLGALVHGQPPILKCAKPKCTTQSDCAQNQCCLNGRCSPLGSASSGCSTVVYVREPDVCTDYCPCGSRLHCQGNPGSTTSEGTCRRRSCKSAEDCQSDECCSNGLCRLKSKGGCGKYCTQSSDCGPNECCQSTIQPAERRRRFSILPIGTCKPLGSSGSGCSTVVYIREPDVYTDYCPCGSRLYCQGNPGSTMSEGTCRYWSCNSAEDCQTDECCSNGFCRLKSSGTCKASETK